MRELTARSVLASAMLGLDPPEAKVADLVRLAGLFGINANRARVALSRMVAGGEATRGADGRYRLEGPLLQRQARQQVSRTGRTRPWDGTWTVVVATTSLDVPGDRTERRRAFTRARLAELREGVWVRPDNVEVDLPTWLDHVVVRLSARIDSGAVEAGKLWDLRGWSERADGLLVALADLAPDDPAALAPGFVLSASVLRHLQADPLLPADLLPDDWSGGDLRSVYDAWDQTYRHLLSQWYRTVG
ncbi:MAG: PaaX family transcriptional regulator C-terminal domain-containing protein [Acidimicrobiales bacterium]